MKLLAKEQQESCENCHYTGEFIGATHSICNLKYSVPKNIPADFHKGSNYDYLFIIKELAEYFENYLLVQQKTLKNTQPVLFQQKKKLQEFIN